MAMPVRRSPLAARQPIAGNGQSIRLAEQPFLSKWIVRVDPAETAERIAAALGFALPLEPLTSSSDGVASLLWLGPDEWMLTSAPDMGTSAAVSLAAALAGIHHQITDVSDYYTAIDLSGASSRELLMKLTTLDVHPRAFRHGMVTGAVFGCANATLWQIGGDETDGGPVFRLFVRWSMADYLWCILAECGREWGVPEQVPVKGERLTIDD